MPDQNPNPPHLPPFLNSREKKKGEERESMDLDDLDNEPIQAPSRTSKFAPKSKFHPKSKQPPKPKQEPVAKTEPPPVQDSAPPTEEPPAASTAAEKMDCDEHGGGDGGGFEPKAEEEKENAEKKEEAMEEEDYVIAEYDVYFNPRDTETQLYVLQYPLRPSWRAYEMDQKCTEVKCRNYTEVRVKQKSAEVEVDLLIDTDSDNYDPDAHTAQKMTKLTLSAPWRPPQVIGYAVGVLMGKKLYLNPVHAVVELRPSMDYLNSGGSKKRNAPEIAFKAEGSSHAVCSWVFKEAEPASGCRRN